MILKCGSRAGAFWSLYRIDFRGTRLGLDRWGSHYGSVANFPGVGFVGTGHTENEDEEIVDLELFVDGKPVQEPESSVACEEIQLVKESRIRDLVLNSEIRVCDNRIFEEVVAQGGEGDAGEPGVSLHAPVGRIRRRSIWPRRSTAGEWKGCLTGTKRQKINQADAVVGDLRWAVRKGGCDLCSPSTGGR